MYSKQPWKIQGNIYFIVFLSKFGVILIIVQYLARNLEMQTHSPISFKEFFTKRIEHTFLYFKVPFFTAFKSSAYILCWKWCNAHTQCLLIYAHTSYAVYKCTFCGVLINLKLRFIVRVSAWVFYVSYMLFICTYNIIHIYWASLSAVLCFLSYNMLHVHNVCSTLTLILIYKYP